MSETAEDRTVAIVSGAYIEDAMEELLVSFLPGLNAERRRKLFDSEGILGPVSAKLDLGLALKAMDAEEHRLMTQIVRIRNRFAHKLEVDSFDHESVAHIIDNKMNMSAEMQEEYRQSFIGDVEEPLQTRRHRFLCISLLLCVNLHNALNRTPGGLHFKIKAGE